MYKGQANNIFDRSVILLYQRFVINFNLFTEHILRYLNKL